MLKSLTTNNIYNVKWKHETDERKMYSASLVKNNQSYIVDPQYPSDVNNINTYIGRRVYNSKLKTTGITYPKHKPLNIYRKQYNTYSKNSNTSAKGVFDKPGIATKKYDIDDTDLCKKENNIFIDNIINSNQKGSNSGISFYEPSLNKVVCISCLPENNIIKSGSTISNKNYSTTMEEYLYKKRKTYEQNLSTKYLVCSDNKSCKNDKPVYKTGSIIKTNNHNLNNTNCTNINNYASVTASSRIARVKYDAIQQYKNNTSNYQQQINNVTNPLNNCKQNGIMFKANPLYQINQFNNKRCSKKS